MSDEMTPDALAAIEAHASARPWNDLRVGYDDGTGGPRSYEAQLCNEAGVGVLIVTHDGSAEGRANVALVMAAVNAHDDLVAEVRRLLAARDAEVRAAGDALAAQLRAQLQSADAVRAAERERIVAALIARREECYAKAKRGPQAWMIEGAAVSRCIDIARDDIDRTGGA